MTEGLTFSFLSIRWFVFNLILKPRLKRLLLTAVMWSPVLCSYLLAALVFVAARRFSLVVSRGYSVVVHRRLWAWLVLEHGF